MKVLLFILFAMCSGCLSLPVEQFEVVEYDSREDYDVDLPTDVQWGKKQVAFMAYLSDCNDLGKAQHIKFDGVLLNDGKGYEAHTGVFRAPYDGVYSFTFNVAQRHKREIRVRLVVNGKNVAGAVAEGRHKRHDAMGGNTAVVHVCKGQSVWVETIMESHIEGSDKYRYSTFSGHLLYERK